MGKAKQVPLSYVSGNVIYGRSLRDAWATFSVPLESHEDQTTSDRRTRWDEVRDVLLDLKADHQILSVTRQWDADAYEDEMGGSTAMHPAARAAYVREQADQCGGAQDSGRAYFSVALGEGPKGLLGRASAGVLDPSSQSARLRGTLRRFSLGAGAPDADLSEEDHRAADSVFSALVSYLPDARPASLAELEWLVRRRWTFGAGEPDVDGLDAPRALVIQRERGSRLRVQDVDVLSWAAPVVPNWRHLTLHGEHGTVHATGLVASELAGDAEPGAEVLELMFGPRNALDFPIDISLCATYRSPEDTQRDVRRQMAAADEAADGEHHADRGLSASTYARTEIARDAEEYDGPMFLSTVTVIFPWRDEHERTERLRAITSVFRSYGVTLRVPVGQQRDVLFEHLPAQRSWVKGFTRRLTAEQIAGMAPTAGHRLGGRSGFVWGTSRGGEVVYRLDPEDGTRLNKPTGILMTGENGAGKTAAASKLATEAAFNDGRVLDISAKDDDHLWFTEPSLAAQTDALSLKPDPALRGLLDPLRNAPPELRRDAAVDFLSALMPQRATAASESELLRAVTLVHDRDADPTCGAVLNALRERATLDSVALSEHLENHATRGLSQLGFAQPGHALRGLGQRQITHMQIENLPAPGRGVSRADYTPLERQGAAVVKLVVLTAMGVLSEFPDETKVFELDECKFITDHDDGVLMIDRLQRLGRSKLAIPVLQTQYNADVGLDRERIGTLFGMVMCFRTADEADAERALTHLLRVEPTERRIRWLVSAPTGMCMMRDHRGQVGVMCVALAPSLHARIDTNRYTRTDRTLESTGG